MTLTDLRERNESNSLAFFRSLLHSLELCPGLKQAKHLDASDNLFICASNNLYGDTSALPPFDWSDHLPADEFWAEEEWDG